MTDKELAEEYCNNEEPFDTTESGEKLYTENDLKYAYLAGAEFGYNKANEWHYPKECENVLCYCKVVDAKFYSIGHTIIGGDNKIRWWSNNKTEELRVIAWKEIVRPNEIK